MQRIAVFVLLGALATSACDRFRASGTQQTDPQQGAATSTLVPAPVDPAAAPPKASAPLTPPDVKTGPLSFSPIAKYADKSVVTVATMGEEVEVSPFGRRRVRQQKGLGTGFIVQRDGVVLTNNHVIEGSNAINVKLADDREFAAQIVGRDPQTDIAVLRIDAKDVSSLSFGDSDTIDVGDWVVAIGNPFGLSHTVSAGIVSAKGRTREDVPLDPSGYYDFIQTDASINPGNSGGPLLNLKGEVVGINTAIRGDAQGIGFAIPINMVKQLLPMLLRDGHVTRSALGILVRDIRELRAEDRVELHLADEKGKSLVDQGAVIMQVTPNGSAVKAGLQPGDVIVSFDGQPIERSTQLQWLASTAGVGKTVTLAVYREGKRMEAKVVLGALQGAAPRRRGLLPFSGP